jgi:Plasmid pRiA4b ORF-3-like protein
VCVAGRRNGPAEDCGGVYAYELTCAATDPANPDHTDAVAELARLYGEFAGPEAMHVTAFDIDEVNETLTGLVVQGHGEPDDSNTGQRNYPQPLKELIRAARTTAGKRELRQPIGKGRLGQPVLVGAATASRIVRPYTWLLDRGGDDGITLTAAG